MNYPTVRYGILYPCGNYAYDKAVVKLKSAIRKSREIRATVPEKIAKTFANLGIAISRAQEFEDEVCVINYFSCPVLTLPQIGFEVISEKSKRYYTSRIALTCGSNGRYNKIWIRFSWSNPLKKVNREEYQGFDLDINEIKNFFNSTRIVLEKVMVHVKDWFNQVIGNGTRAEVKERKKDKIATGLFYSPILEKNYEKVYVYTVGTCNWEHIKPLIGDEKYPQRLKQDVLSSGEKPKEWSDFMEILKEYINEDHNLEWCHTLEPDHEMIPREAIFAVTLKNREVIGVGIADSDEKEPSTLPTTFLSRSLVYWLSRYV